MMNEENQRQELVLWAKNYAKEFNQTLNGIRKKHKLKVDDLIAMSQSTDPYWMTESRVLKAEWAMQIVDNILKPYLKRLGLEDDHLRNIHYVLTGIPTAKTWDGERYINDSKCWGELKDGFRDARYLEFVDYRLIRDKKNQFIHRTFYTETNTFEEAIEEAKKNINSESIISDTFIHPFYELLNQWSFQPVHIEIWLEKDLALVEKVAEEYSINAILGEGDTSCTMVYDLIDRIIDSERPVRIAYISDCDVVGTNMVKAMSRKVEFVLWQRGLDKDVKIISLMATPKQVKELALPTTPMKLSKSKGYETRKKEWLRTRDLTGAVEVNSLHAQHPEYFEETLVKFIQSYIDIDKWNKVIEYRKKIPQIIAEQIDNDELDLTSFHTIMDAIEWDKLTTPHEETIQKIKDIDFKYESNDENYKWLLDTDRDYGEQLVYYKKYDKNEEQ